jgi:hypothetical protein
MRKPLSESGQTFNVAPRIASYDPLQKSLLASRDHVFGSESSERQTRHAQGFDKKIDEQTGS